MHDSSFRRDNAKLLVLGAGLTGLSAAYHHPDGVVYEKEPLFGGHGKSHASQGFIFDEGIHVVHTTDQAVLDLYKKVGVEFLVHQRDAWIRSFGALTRYPFQANTFGLPVDVVKDCLLGFIENSSSDPEKITNYEDSLYDMFGKGIAEHFMIPYAEKFWGVHPRELTTDWVDIRHPRPSLEDVIDGALGDQKKGFGVNAEFRYPMKGGFGAIGDQFAKQIGDRLHLGKKVTKIDLENRCIEFNGTETVPYRHVISTIPLPEVIRCIPDAPDDVREAAAMLRTNSFFVVNLGVNREHISGKHWIYYLEKEYPFVRISFPSNFSADVAPSGTTAISAEIAYNVDTNPLTMSHKRMVERVIESLREEKILRSDDTIVFTDTIDIKYAYIIHDQNRVPAVRRIHDYLRKFDFYPCGRYGDWGYLWSHDAVLSGRDVALALKQGSIPHAPAGLCSQEGCGCVGEFDV